jgi:outer membrane protein assembly factor BamD (BamD/ComL family)
MSLEELPRDTPEAKRRHALGLLGAGQLSGGIPELRELMAAEPDADWIPDARLAIARSLVAGGRFQEAFDEFQAIVTEYPEHPVAPVAAEGRYTAARLLCRENMTAGALLYDRLFESESEDGGRRRATREKADAYFAAGRFLDAGSEYALLTGDPEWGTYAAYMIALCMWREAEWLDLGLQQLEVAERELDDFASKHDQDVHADEARRLAEKARLKQAELNWQIALYYRDVEGKPWASVNYLHHIMAQFPGSRPAEWAREELDEIDEALEAPLRGTMRRIELPGVGPSPGQG